MSFSPMDAASDAPTGCARAVVKAVVALSLPFVLSPREVAAEAATNVVAAFTACFSRLHQRRVQFAEEQQEALLSEDERFSEAAVLELRRRVMDSGGSTASVKRWGPSASAPVPAPDHPPMSRWKQRKLLERARAKSSPTQWRRPSPEKEQEAFSTLASDTEKALDQILETAKIRKNAKSCETLDAEAVRRLSVDELLANRSIAPEKTGGEPPALLDLQDDEECCNNVDSGPLHEWLSRIDASRAEEYCVYAKQLQEHGFLTLEDLAQLESDDDVDQAMSEVGIAKFAHRLRIRKAIQRLHASSDAAAVASVPVAASA